MGGNESILDTNEMNNLLRNDPKIYRLKSRAAKILINVIIQSDNTVILQNTSDPKQLTNLGSPKTKNDISELIQNMEEILDKSETTFTGHISYQ